MDESWSMQMGMKIPRRRSTEETSSDRLRRSLFGLNSTESETLDPIDFHDVFGGPPRSLFSRQFSGDFTAGNCPNSFYRDIFRSPDSSASANNGRNLPVFRIPVPRGGGGISRRNEGFYDDIFGSDEDRRLRSRSNSNPKSKSKSKSKSNSSSVLSSEDLSPLRPSIAENVVFSSLASKLRPIEVPCRWNSSSIMREEQQKLQGMSDVSCTHPSSMDHQFMENDSNENLRSSHFEFSRPVSSRETISLEPNSYRSIKISVDDQDSNSQSSTVSSLRRDPEAKARIQDKAFKEQEEDEVTSSYVIGITSDQRDGTDEAVSIDEAIAWAKEKFQAQSSEVLESGNQPRNMRKHVREPFAEREERKSTGECLDQQIDGHGRM
ncbi:hypothetical protein HHK36_001526 [Tetracentron sinense]|uniref:Uncharacterized protein n=1 Tax=Tetracentron sinense TaxID=13715 RepID=A0A834ZXE1_TETSI|nr:hypothetical protein HHK36_001526 [Tetracentron sinense]